MFDITGLGVKVFNKTMPIILWDSSVLHHPDVPCSRATRCDNVATVKAIQNTVEKSIDTTFKCAVSAESLQSRGSMLLLECMHELTEAVQVTLRCGALDAVHAGLIALIEVLGRAWQTAAWCLPRQEQCASFARLDARSAPSSEAIFPTSRLS